MAPWIVGAFLLGWAGLGVGIGAQFTSLYIWIILHELTHPGARKGPRIYKTLDGIVGFWRNHLALIWTTLAVPAFWLVRFTEFIVYPGLTWTIRLPKYKQSEWVTISRHKFSGLVGYDLVWCLYCDWMTGLWSLGSEMLRNLESFWCPIRFYSDKKCENCVIDFPDIEGGWVDADGTMGDVTSVLKEKFTKGAKDNPWYGHPARLTIEKKDIEDEA
ncbi:MAG: hypothetical protein O7G85_00145 [Planctomycetota bacterium]|nr:hypothetical protein [Planctomycetota bacterium]